MRFTLHIGDKAYSSWSLRGWLLLKSFGISFETRLHPMFTAAFDAFVTEVSPARSVPTLEITEDDGSRSLVWDSLAIAETLAERRPEAGHWPEGLAARTAARSMAAEMHSSYAALRTEASMNTRLTGTPPTALSPAAAADLVRIESLWSWARRRFGEGGPFLFGAAFTAADAFFAPVAFRVAGHGLSVGPEARTYVQALLDHPDVAAWASAAAEDPRRIARYERT